MLSILLLAGFAHAKKAPKTPPPPIEGWHHEEGWKGDCYYPKNFAALGEGDRRAARADTLAALKSQWDGGRDDGVSFDSNVTDDIQNTLWGRPEKTEAMAKQNLDLCVAAMKSGDTSNWQAWIGGLNGALNAGECNNPLANTLFDYLDLGVGWQRPVSMCAGDKAHIFGTVQDRYRLSDKGPWMNIEGTKDPAIGTDWPCNIEGCTVGKLVAKFTGESGVELLFPVGADANFEAPENGTLMFSINDNTWYDNKWFTNGRVDDHAAITIEPVGGLQ